MSDFGHQPTLPAVGSDERPPEVFADRYEVRALLGQGGMGAVFRVFDRELDEEVALKVLRVGLASDPSAIDRFRREVKLARRVTHPNVARTYDLGRHEDTLFLTMELVVGESLASLLRSARPRLVETLRIAEHLARGLSSAHAAGVVHRDLKPDNVMRCPGPNGRIVITDFGIARLAEGARAPVDLHLTANQIIGTPAYMAPEQLTGKAIDGRTDVYAFGTLLFELLTGVLPFHGDSVFAIVAARLAEDPPDPRTHDPGIPEAVALLTMKAMAKNREDRPDAEMMLQAIERLRGGGERHDHAPSPKAASTTGSFETRTLAVAPVDVGANPGGTGDDLGAALADGASSLRGLRVLAPAVVRDAIDQRGLRVAARELGAKWLLETSLRAESGRARARARLHDVASSTQIWAAEPIDLAAGETFALEDRLVRVVTDALRERLGDSRVVAPAVRAFYDRARDATDRRTVPSVREAVAILEEGLAQFPGDPWLLGHLAANLVRLYGLTGSMDADLGARAEEVALRALSADPTLGEAYLAVGLLRCEQGEMRAAAQALQEALTRAPLLSDAHTALGLLLAETGLVDEGLRRLDVALRLDPRSAAARFERVRVRALLGDREAAEADLRAGDEVASHSLLVRLVVWWNDRARAAELADAFERAATGAPWEIAAPLLRAFARGEYFPGAPQLFQGAMAAMRAAERNSCRMLEAAAEYFAVMGKTDLALEWFERAESLPFVDVLWMDRCVCLDSLRNEPRFVRVRGLVAARAAAMWR